MMTISNGLINRLNTAHKTMRDHEDRSIEISQTKVHIEKHNIRIYRTEHPRPAGLFYEKI